MESSESETCDDLARNTASLTAFVPTAGTICGQAKSVVPSAVQPLSRMEHMGLDAKKTQNWHHRSAGHYSGDDLHGWGLHSAESEAGLMKTLSYQGIIQGCGAR